MDSQPHIVITSYRREDWQKWKSLCGDDMCETWDEWNAGAEANIRSAMKDHHIVHTPIIAPEEYQSWARENQKEINGYTRIEFAATKLKIAPENKLPEKLPTQPELNRLLRKAVEKDPNLRLSNISTPFLRRPEASICPIFRRDEKEMPEQFGSGILLEIGSQYFLISAAHVLEQFKGNHIEIPGNEGLMSLSGIYYVSKIPNGSSRAEDTLDWGFFPLKPDIANAIHNDLIFLAVDECDFMDTTSQGDAYTLIGYKSESSRSTDGKAETEVTRITGDGVLDHRYQKIGVTSKSHTLIQYREKKAINSNTINRPPKQDFGGMSGGGVFAWSKDLPDPRALAQPKLTAIVTTYIPHHNVFLATRLAVIVKAILKVFPHLATLQPTDF